MCMNCVFANALGGFITGKLDRRSFVQASLACVGVAASLSLPGSAFGAVAGADSPSVIFRNGKVYTLDAKKPWAQAVAVAGDRIVAVGSEVTHEVGG